MRLSEQTICITHNGLALLERLCPTNTIRFSMVNPDLAEVGVCDEHVCESIFKFRKRTHENITEFTTVVIVPTGVDAAIGGHAGDAGPVVKMFGAVSDSVVTHPNVVNASDINEMPDNCVYLEGSVLDRLLMGTVWLEPVRNNRLLVILDKHDDEDIVNSYINAVNAARATYGLKADIYMLPERLKMAADWSESGRAIGSVENFEVISDVVAASDHDAFAIASMIDVPEGTHSDYFTQEMANPWGGVEALLTHAVSHLTNKPSAHSPMCNKDELNIWPSEVDQRKAAEAISNTFLQCILKGLQRSPKIHTEPCPELLSAEDVSVVVVPKGCYGLSVMAAHEQGIPVIEVGENTTLMKNNIKAIKVANYWEAAGIVASMRAGIDPLSVRR